MSSLDLGVINGPHVWHGLQCLDGDPVFNALLGDNDPQSGFMDITVGAKEPSRQRHLHNSAILETTIDGASGTVKLTDFAPRRPTFDYGARKAAIMSGGDHVRFIRDTAVLRVTTDASINEIPHESEFSLDGPLTLIVGADESVRENPDTLVRNFVAETQSYWHTWVRDLNIPFDWQQAVIRAAITLKLCSYEDTGAVLAAPTTSVPEASNTPRTERLVDTLPGYRGGGPVRVGNAAVSQRRNETYGSMVPTAAQMFWDERLPRQGDLELYRQLCVVGNEAHRAALTPDAGLWEYREREEVHTFSAAMCWAAQHRLGLIAKRVGLDAESREWLASAGVLRQQVLQRGTAQEGWLSGVLDRDMLDASSLVPPEIGLLRPDDPRFHATIGVAGKPSNAFLLCTFWHIDALASVGRRPEALELFNNLLARRNHVGLLSEDIDPHSGELWGNFPQTYSQVGLILSAMRLSRSWEEGLWHAS